MMNKNIGDCALCSDPGKHAYRLEQAEKKIVEVDARLTDTKKDVFARFDRLHNYVIATLTTAVVSALLLIGDIIINFGR